MSAFASSEFVAIACGGTGGHLFPGIAVGHELVARGCDVALLISPKDVDQTAVRGVAHEFKVVTLPAVGLTGRNVLKFASASLKSYRAALAAFRGRPPAAVLAMGGFTSAPPVLAGKRLGAATFLHESNTIPGRANRWLAHVVDECFVGFPEASPGCETARSPSPALRCVRDSRFPIPPALVRRWGSPRKSPCCW